MDHEPDYDYEVKKWADRNRTFNIYIERDNELLIDNDFQRFTEKNAKCVILGLAKITAIYELPSKRNTHIIVKLSKRVPLMARIALRGAMGDDRTRIGIDVQNALIKCPSLIITPFNHEELWRKPDYRFKTAKECLSKMRKLRKITYLSKEKQKKYCAELERA